MGGVEFQERAMEAGQRWPTVSIQPAWPELSGGPGCHPIYLPPTEAQAPQGQVGT